MLESSTTFSYLRAVAVRERDADGDGVSPFPRSRPSRFIRSRYSGWAKEAVVDAAGEGRRPPVASGSPAFPCRGPRDDDDARVRAVSSRRLVAGHGDRRGRDRATDRVATRSARTSHWLLRQIEKARAVVAPAIAAMRSRRRHRRASGAPARETKRDHADPPESVHSWSSGLMRSTIVPLSLLVARSDPARSLIDDDVVEAHVRRPGSVSSDLDAADAGTGTVDQRDHDDGAARWRPEVDSRRPSARARPTCQPEPTHTRHFLGRSRPTSREQGICMYRDTRRRCSSPCSATRRTATEELRIEATLTLVLMHALENGPPAQVLERVVGARCELTARARLNDAARRGQS